MIKPSLDDLRKTTNSDTNHEFVQLLGKIIGLKIQKAELDNPRLPNINIANLRKRQRDNSNARADADYLMAKLCGYPPDYEVDEEFKTQDEPTGKSCAPAPSRCALPSHTRSAPRASSSTVPARAHARWRALPSSF